MNRKIIPILGFLAIPLGALLLSACGPQDLANENLTLDSASDKFLSWNGLIYTEYGRCNDTQDNNGDGLADMADPDCHIGPGPMRDLSLFNYPFGHNFNPDITATQPGGPGFGGGFRDRAQITRWLRFLTEPDGFVSGIDIYGAGVDPLVVPTPAPLLNNVNQGTYAQGNNNNVDMAELHESYLAHGGILGPNVAAQPGATPVAPVVGTPSTEFIPPYYNEPVGLAGDWPGAFYAAQGPRKWGRAIGSQGALKKASTGNPDND